jgi:cytochrome c5
MGKHVLSLGAALSVLVLGSAGCSRTRASQDDGALSGDDARSAVKIVREGRNTFRNDTFGDEAFWGDTLHLHQAIASSVSPKTALAVGLKVDVDALPKALQDAIAAGQVDLDAPATTVALLKLDSVLGVKGFFDASGNLKSMGITCALCHSTVDNSFAPGIGHRLDGWANRDLDVGTIVSLAPNLQPVADLLGVDVDTLKTVIRMWGPGRFDAEVFMDGKAINPATGKPAPTLIPPAYGLAGVNLHTWTGWGSVTHWNAFVANLEMHGQGTFVDARLNNAAQFPIATKAHFFDVRPPPGQPDLITSKLPALHVYQLTLEPPKPPEGSFDEDAARRGQALFNGKAKCATCHVAPIFTEPGWNMHTAAEMGIDSFQADRAPDHGYRTSPLRGLFAHQKGGFYHDGRFATLADVVSFYNSPRVNGMGGFDLGLTDQEKADLVEYLKSL